jgi:amino acid transporter
VASGVPALVLFSIGAIAQSIGTLSYLIWTVSIVMGFLQSFVYAEIAGLFPQKTGGAAVYGAIAWVRYSRYIAPLSVWTYWLAWTPVLSIGSALAAGYLLTGLFRANSKINTWSVELIDLGALQDELTVRFNAQFVIAAALLLVVFALQHHGILRAARIQMIVGLAVLIPLTIVGVVPLVTGDVISANLSPLVPLNGRWNMAGFTLVAGGLFIAAWSTYGFETAVCYTREFRNPARDTSRAIFYAGALCLGLFILVPLTFQGSLGPAQLATQGADAGTGVGSAMASMVGGGAVVEKLLLVMLLLALLLSVMTTMAGSSRVLYQGSMDGWLPRYLSRVNRHGAPTRAMWTDLGFNLILLLMSQYIFVLAAANVCYIIFNFINLNAGWLHRKDSPELDRPWRAPTAMLGIGAALAFVNMVLMGWGANVWGGGTLATGLVFAALIVPIFLYRHFVQDKGRFPDSMYEHLELPADGSARVLVKRAGWWPYAALAGGVVAVVMGQVLARAAG